MHARRRVPVGMRVYTFNILDVTIFNCLSPYKGSFDAVSSALLVIKGREGSVDMYSASEPQPENYSCTCKLVLMANPRARCFLSPASLQLQQLPSGQQVSDILQQMCGEISQTTTAEMVEVANSAAPRSKLQDLLPVYFYSWQLQSSEAVIIHLLLHYFILWRDRDGSERREDRQALEEYIERLKTRVAELEKKLDASQSEIRKTKAELEETEPEVNRLTKQVQDLKMENEKLQNAHDEVSACHLSFQLG